MQKHKRSDDGTFDTKYDAQLIADALTLQTLGYSDDYVCKKFNIHRVYYTRVKKHHYKRDDAWELVTQDTKIYHNNYRKKWKHE